MRTVLSKPTVISLFSGAMGLDLGFERKFEIRVALDCNQAAIETIKKNRPKIPLIPRSILNVKTSEILKEANLSVGEPTVVIGGAPCQPFSTAGKRTSIAEATGKLVFEYLRVVKEARPEYFVFENVAGLVTAAIKHISFYERVKKRNKELAKEHQLGSAFEIIFEEFKKSGYHIVWSVLNAADFGAAQKRKRLIILGSRDDPNISLPTPTHGQPESDEVKNGYRKPWVTLREVLGDQVEEAPEFLPFPPSWGKYMKYIPEGGNWRNLPLKFQMNALGGAYEDSWKDRKGGRTGFYRRLRWSEPSPTLLTSPIYKCSVLAHPSDNRPLSVREYAIVQGFPKSWVFSGGTHTKYRLIGQAVPILLGKAISLQILQSRGSRFIQIPKIMSTGEIDSLVAYNEDTFQGKFEPSARE